VPIRWLAYTGLVGAACFTISVIVLRWLQPNLNPLNRAMSDYAHGSQGWLAATGLFGLGIGSLALTFGLARDLRGLGARAGQWCLAIWSVCGLAAGIFPDDLPGQPSSLSGSIHGTAAILGIFILPVAAVLIAWSVRRDRRWQKVARFLFAVAVAMVVGFVIVNLSFLPVLTSAQAPVLFGLAERLFFLIALSWLALASIGLLKATDRMTAASPS
jgi:hypothetical membrane protein